MNIEELRNLCLSFPGTTEDIKWGNDLCFCVAEKMFLITGLEVPAGASFKVAKEDFDRYCQQQGFKPAPYLARYGWVYVEDIEGISTKEWNELAKNSWQLIKEKLSPAKKKEYGIP